MRFLKATYYVPVHERLVMNRDPEDPLNRLLFNPAMVVRVEPARSECPDPQDYKDGETYQRAEALSDAIDPGTWLTLAGLDPESSNDIHIGEPYDLVVQWLEAC